MSTLFSVYLTDFRSTHINPLFKYFNKCLYTTLITHNVVESYQYRQISRTFHTCFYSRRHQAQNQHPFEIIHVFWFGGKIFGQIFDYVVCMKQMIEGL